MPKGDRLLQRMRATSSGWRASDLESVYVAHGFEKEEGERHTLYIHPTYPDLRATVTRASGEIATLYARVAVRLIGELKRLEEADDASTART